MENKLEWDWIEDGWEAASAACYEPGDWITWRFIQKDGKWVDDSAYELRIQEVVDAKFDSPEEAKLQYQTWENEMIEEFSGK